MGFGDREELRLLVNDDGLDLSSSSSSSYICQCRICHEEEEESSTTMETPCACSGTLKFAHRGCIQRWCDEKGSTLCEICLQNFEPDYAVPPKKTQVADMVVTIRGSLEIPRLNYEPQGTGSDGVADGVATSYYAECASAAERSASCCRSVAVAFTILLLVRHLIAVLAVGADHYAFNIVTVLVLRASGILLPSYFIMRLISVVHQGRLQYQLEQLQRRNNSSAHWTEDDEELQQHTIQIHS
ncbi:uncharacterized protein LOC109708937 [Ananas comosus]|uniref:Putative E3 ubiquitin ligase SUD1 n=1 Tax=Ananas comosus TaxID=4615 RepID=A0A199VK39_ANACO|nr:uncharacterized protein LOC109708937 [Ananas comosus]OAY77373.1 putative E3 ubiquitin ligase SUD1 [Ananas comosus]